jgi:hypothetical protein
MLKSVKIKIGFNLIQFSTYDIGIALKTCEKLFNITSSQTVELMDKYALFILSDKTATCFSMDIGEQKTSTVEFIR